MRLSIYDACDAEQSVADCEPLVRTTFDCNRFRGYLPEVPSSEDPYLMHVDVRVNPRSEPPFSAGAACVAVAGSRERSIRPGRITDLAVYQLVVDALAFDPDSGQLDDRLDLEACEG